MQPLYQLVPLDERARTYLNQIAVERTRQTNQYALQAFYSFRRYHSPAPLAWKDMTFDVLAEFGRWLQRKGFSPLSCQTYGACVSEFLKYALAAKWLQSSFSIEAASYQRRHAKGRHAYPIPKPDPRIPELIEYYDRQPLPVPADETPRAVERARVKTLCLLRNRAVLHTLFDSAGRVSEVASLQRQQFQDGKRNEAAITGKGDKQRFIFLTPAAQDAIQAYCAAREDESESLFISHGKHKGEPLTRQMIWQIVTNAAKALGIEAHPHDLRHYRASQMLNAGAPIEVIAVILGHTNIGTTSRVYAHVNRETARAVFDRTSCS